jgi:hypothetical protein
LVVKEEEEASKDQDVGKLVPRSQRKKAKPHSSMFWVAGASHHICH